MTKAWLKSLVAAMGLLGASQSALADTSNYTVYTNAAGDIYLKAPEQFVLIHSDVSVPLFTMPADGYLKVINNGNGTWQTVAISAAEWNSLGLYQGGNTVESLKYADMNGDGTADMFLALRGGGYIVIYRKKDGTFITSASPADVRLGTSFELKDVNGDGLLDVVSGGKVLSYGLPTFNAVYSGLPAAQQQANHVGMTAGSFRVDESGQATYSIPLAIPAGIAGVQPQVALNYSSAAGAGIVGMGWNLSGSSSISRCGKTIVQDGYNQAPQFNSNDAYCLDGQRMVLVSGSYGAVNSTYRLELDDFSRIKVTSVNDYGPETFELINKANEKHIFGAGTSTQVAPGKSVASAWSVSSISDSFNNTINFSYYQNGVDGKTPGNFLLKEISYAGGTAKVIPSYQVVNSPKSIFVNGQEVLFKYRMDFIKVVGDANRSPYTYRFYHLGHQDNQFSYLNTVQECLAEGRVVKFPSGQTDTVGSECKKEILFAYSGVGNLIVSTSKSTTATVPSSVPMSASFADIDGDGRLDYFYPDGSNLNNYLASSTALNKTVSSQLDARDPRYTFADINGDGITDILYVANGKWRFKYYGPRKVQRDCTVARNSEACYALVGSVASDYSEEYSTNINGNTGAVFADVNGDGLVDWIAANEQKLQVYKNIGGNFETVASTIAEFPTSVWPKLDLTNILAARYYLEVKADSVGDFNGDGNSDLLVTLTSNFDVDDVDYDGNPTVSTTSISASAVLHNKNAATPSFSLEVLPYTVYAPKLVDINADGLVDIVDNQNDGFIYLLSKGTETASFAAPIAITTPTKVVYKNKHLFQFMDVNADGAIDLVGPNIAPAPITGWPANYLGVRLGAYDKISGRWGLTAQTVQLPVSDSKNPLSDNVATQWADADGDGDLDLFVRTNGSSTWSIYNSNAVNGEPTHKISRIHNGFGAITTISYSKAYEPEVFTPSRAVLANGTINPDLIAPQAGMSLVKEVTSEVRRTSGYVTEFDRETGKRTTTLEVLNDTVGVLYKYSGFLMHKKGRGALGFNQLTTIDKQTGIKTTTTYHQDWPFTGRPKETIVATADGKQISRATSTWATKKVADGGDFVYLQASTEQGSQVTSAGTIVPIKKVETTNEYDSLQTDATAWGNLTKTVVKQYGYIGDNNTETLLLTTTTNNQYDGWNTSNSKRFGRLSKADVTQSQAAVSGLQELSEQTRSSLFTYNSASGLLESEEIGSECRVAEVALTARPVAGACDQSNWRKTTYTYHAGLKTQTKVETSYGTRYESVQYSADNRFVIAKSDGASGDATANFETYLYNGSTSPVGRIYETVVTGPNKLLSLTRYNAWGEVAESVDATGVTAFSWQENCETSELKAYCGEFDEFITRTKRAGTPAQAEITDMFGRVSKKLAVGFNGAWKQTTVAFDAQGRLEKEYQAEAATSGSPTAKFTSYSYDNYGRLAKTTNPDNTTVEVKYLGATTSTKDEEGFWRDEVRDGLGRTVFTSDPYVGSKPTLLGGVKQSYDAYGNNVRTDVLALVDSTGKPAVASNGVRVETKVTETASFDRYGRRLSSTSASKGTWYYGYNGFGELISQRNGRGQMVTNSYDRLGRLLESNSEDGKVCYSYGTDPSKRNVGKLIELRSFGKDTACNTTAIPNYRETYAFDDLGRPAATETLQKGKLFQQMAFYDDIGRMYKQLLPGGVTVKQEYNAAGFQYKTIADNTVISEIKAMDDAGRVTQAAFVGGSKRSVEYTPERGFIKNIKVQDGLNNTLYTVDYGYNLRGDTKSRQSNYYNGTSSSLVNENYTYSSDGHFRLEKRDVAVTAPQVLGNLVTPMSQSFSYDSLGNLKTKSGVGTYEYDSTNPYLLRKTTGAAAGVRSYVMTGATDYDAHGNIKADGQRIFMYNQADMVFLIAKGIDSTKFEYAPDNSRIYREDTRSGSVTKTWYVGKTYEYSEKGSDTEQRWYIGNVVMSQSSKTSGTNFEVLHGDAQGSTVTVTDGSGKLVSHSLYDAWGQQSVLQVGPTSQLFIQSLQRRGYTGHENVEGLGIIHMNGRIYDPLLARFVQADPTLQFAQLSQGYNRYSYVLNNPMTYTDPSGYFVKWLMEKTGIADALRFIASVPILDALVTAAVCSAGAPACGIFVGLKTYAVTGSLGAGIRAGVIAFASAKAFEKIGEHFGELGAQNVDDVAWGGAHIDNYIDFGGNLLTPGQVAGQISAHALTGGVISTLNGGKFGNGFFSAGVTKGLGGAILPGGASLSSAEVFKGTLASMVIGGTASLVSGGNFANGARTAAYQYLFNQASASINRGSPNYRQIWKDVGRAWDEYWGNANQELNGTYSLSIGGSYIRGNIGFKGSWGGYWDTVGMQAGEYQQIGYNFNPLVFDKVFGVETSFSISLDYTPDFNNFSGEATAYSASVPFTPLGLGVTTPYGSNNITAYSMSLGVGSGFSMVNTNTSTNCYVGCGK